MKTKTPMQEAIDKIEELVSSRNFQKWEQLKKEFLEKERKQLESYTSQPMSAERNKYKYLIERKDTNEWYCMNITGYYGTTYEGETFGKTPDKKNDWTNNANDALQFNSRQEAELFIKGQEYLHDVLHFDCEITEHEFISKNANPSPSPITQTTTSMSAEQVDGAARYLEESGISGDTMINLDDNSGAVYLHDLLAGFATAPTVKAEGWVSEIKRRHQIIMSEPNGIVRDTMIADLLIGID